MRGVIQGVDLNHLRRDTDHIDMLNAFDHFLKLQDQIANSKLDHEVLFCVSEKRKQTRCDYNRIAKRNITGARGRE